MFLNICQNCQRKKAVSMHMLNFPHLGIKTAERNTVCKKIQSNIYLVIEQCQSLSQQNSWFPLYCRRLPGVKRENPSSFFLTKFHLKGIPEAAACLEGSLHLNTPQRHEFELHYIPSAEFTSPVTVNLNRLEARWRRCGKAGHAGASSPCCRRKEVRMNP